MAAPELEQLICDYLVIGAGARGLAFADALLAERQDYSLIIVDDRDEPGGHWNDAYKFARLHQPSAFYGVTSRKLESDRPRRPGAPLDRATKDELLVYFGMVIEDLLSTGSVQYYPMCIASQNGSLITSRLDPDMQWQVTVKRKIVDSTFMAPEIPLTHAAPFAVQGNALVVPPNSLPSLFKPHPKYVVIGSGRTGIDTVLWLLSRGVTPERVHWVMPRDAWLFRREAMEPEQVANTRLAFLALAAATPTVEALCLSLEKAKIWCRLDLSRLQETFHGAFVSEEELAQLRRVPNIIRMGHVQTVSVERLQLEGGAVITGEGTLHIDCTNSLANHTRRPVPAIWTKRHITLQQVAEVAGGVGEYNVPFAAALIGFLEALMPDSEEGKNEMCTPAPFPDCPVEWLRAELRSLRGGYLWADGRIASWLCRQRPGQFSAMRPEELRQVLDTSTGPLLEKAASNLELVLQKYDQEKMLAARAQAQAAEHLTGISSGRTSDAEQVALLESSSL